MLFLIFVRSCRHCWLPQLAWTSTFDSILWKDKRWSAYSKATPKASGNSITLPTMKASFFRSVMKAMPIFGVLKEAWEQYKAQSAFLHRGAPIPPQTYMANSATSTTFWNLPVSFRTLPFAQLSMRNSLWNCGTFKHSSSFRQFNHTKEDLLKSMTFSASKTGKDLQ